MLGIGEQSSTRAGKWMCNDSGGDMGAIYGAAAPKENACKK